MASTQHNPNDNSEGLAPLYSRLPNRACDCHILLSYIHPARGFTSLRLCDKPGRGSRQVFFPLIYTVILAKFSIFNILR